MNNKVRTFIALELSDEARSELSRIIEALKEADAAVKWARPESVHLTLKFLGSVSEAQIPKISERLKEAALQTKPFEITLGDMGVFPNWNHVKVLWVGIDKGVDSLETLAGEIEEAMAKEGFEKETRPFRSHLTLGRVKNVKNKDKLKELVDAIEVKSVSIHISRIVLFKSDLTPTGAVHTPLDIFTFLKKMKIK